MKDSFLWLVRIISRLTEHTSNIDKSAILNLFPNEFNNNFSKHVMKGMSDSSKVEP